MEFRFAPEGEAFRQELRSFLKTELPEGWTGPLDEDDEDWEFTLEMRKKLAEKGWLAMAWPEEYGGIGASHMMLVIFAEEMAYHCAPGRDAFGTRMLAPVLFLTVVALLFMRRFPLFVRFIGGESPPLLQSVAAATFASLAPAELKWPV